MGQTEEPTPSGTDAFRRARFDPGQQREAEALDWFENPDVRVGAPERARAAALAHASFRDTGTRRALETAVQQLTDEELVPALREIRSIAGLLTDSVVVAGATTPKRSLLIAETLYQAGSRGEAYSVVMHGLSMEEAEGLTTDVVVQLLPVAVLEGLAAEAEARGEDDVAGILEAVALVAIASSGVADVA